MVGEADEELGMKNEVIPHSILRKAQPFHIQHSTFNIKKAASILANRSGRNKKNTLQNYG
nr:MAG TPA: hypothetical protein [Caudoviricetes sp.]